MIIMVITLLLSVIIIFMLIITHPTPLTARSLLGWRIRAPQKSLLIGNHQCGMATRIRRT